MRSAAVIVILVLLVVANALSALEVQRDDLSNLTLWVLYVDVLACACALVPVVRRAIEERARALAGRPTL